MSFSSDVKSELAGKYSEARHCLIAETAAFVCLSGEVERTGQDTFSVRIHTENASAARKCFTLLQKGFNIKAEIVIRQNQYLKKSRVYLITVSSHEDAVRLLKTLRLWRADGAMGHMDMISHLVVQRECCKRAFVRGAFLAAGSLSAPEKSYHFEIVCGEEGKARRLREIIADLGIDAKIVARKKYHVVYVKEGSQIVALLGMMGAHVSLMNLENVRILKEMRNNVNRKVNCETANINKTVSAAVKQMEDIRYIQEHGDFESLPRELRYTAELRMEYPQATLKELGMMLTPAVGKSGINHRLRKISEIACKLRGNKEEQYYDEKTDYNSACERTRDEAGSDSRTGGEPV